MGSAKVLAWLQQARILSATEYIFFKHTEDEEGAQLILNDMLEMEFSLLADLCRNFDCANATSVKIIEILTEAMHRLCRDLCEDPALVQVNYVEAVEPMLLGRIFSYCHR